MDNNVTFRAISLQLRVSELRVEISCVLLQVEISCVLVQRPLSAARHTE